MKKTVNIIFITISPFILTSCDWDGIFSFAGDFMCTYAQDSDHCIQFIAVQSGSPSKCDEIEGVRFKDIGSNPPRDRCYLQIAINKGDYTICEKIQGGEMSYTKEECIIGVGDRILSKAINEDDIKGCKKLKNIPTLNQDKYLKCISQIATIEKLKSRDEKIEELIEKLKNNPNDKETRKELEELKDIKQATYEMMSDIDKQNYFKEKREEIMAGIEDDVVKSAISKEYTLYKSSGETNINKMLEKLEQITQKQKTLKRLDEQANELTDTIKSQIQEIVNGKQDEIIEKMGESAKDWIEKNGGEELRLALKKYEWSMEKYEKGSKMYEDAIEKYNKLKKNYDEIMEIYNKIDEVNKMVALGKIDEKKANVLKGAVFLDKGLEYSLEYVPIFGSTMSKISKETFDTVIKLAKKRAERSNALEKCFEDPANCDTDNISGY